jgi:ribosome recycling factor
MKEIVKETEEKMNHVIEATKKDFAAVRTGRATPALLDRVHADYYGTPTPINQMANISVPEPRTIVIQPWDKTALSAIEKAIQKSDLSLVPNNDGSVIRINIPQLTEERRKELVKLVKKEAEEKRVAIRNIRRDSNEALKAKEKAKQITEDETKKGQEEVQKVTDRFIVEVDKLLAAKEKEIMEV